MAPGLTFGDSGDFALAALQLGIPHPTGYPLYTMVGHACIRLWPLLEPVWVLNVLSAVCAASAVALLYLLAVRLLKKRWAAVLPAATFAVTPSFWSHATTAEVYALQADLPTHLQIVVPDVLGPRQVHIVHLVRHVTSRGEPTAHERVAAADIRASHPEHWKRFRHL